MVKRNTKLLTLELDLETLAEFGAAARVFGSRSKSTFMNQYVVVKIREARQAVSTEEFANLVELEKEKILKRSREKSQQRINSLSGLKPGKEANIDFKGAPYEEIPDQREPLDDDAAPVIKKRVV